MTTPRIGDEVYVDSEYYLSHGRDDFEGGRASVSSVRHEHGRPYIEVTERPGTLYDWLMLHAKQRELAARFGERRAHPDPDVRAEFNEY